MRRRLGPTFVVAIAWLVMCAPLGQAQDPADDPPPTDLWEQYPLEETTPQQAPEARGGGPAPDRSAGEDGGIGPGVIAATVLAPALVLALFARRRHRARAEPGRDERVRPPVPVPVAAETAPAVIPPPSRVPALFASDGDPDEEPEAEDAEFAADTGPELALGYIIVRGDEGAGDARVRDEARQIQAACRKRGLELGKLVRDVESHSGSDLERPGLMYALNRLAVGEYSCLVVTRLDRLTRSAANLGALVRTLEQRDARLVVIDMELDTRTRAGRVAVDALATASWLDRKKLEERPRKGPEAARERRRSSDRPAVAETPLKERIADMRARGMTLQAIADTLNDEGVPTMRGGAMWRPSSVQAAAGYKRPSRRKVPRTEAGG